MITALIATISGLVSGAAPKLIGEFTASREHKRELEMLEKQTELQLKIAEAQGQTKVAEMDRQVDISAYEAQSKIAVASLQSTGIKFVDTWNGCLRPFAVTIIIILFAVIAGFYAYEVLSTVNDIGGAQKAVKLLWGSLIGESIQAVLGFLFGYRSSRK
jgi:hypothetical protein